MADSGGDLVPGALTEYLADDWGYFVRSFTELERSLKPERTHFQAIRRGGASG